MQHLCDCGEIAEVKEGNLYIATCPKCGSFYLYPHEVREPPEVEKPKPRPAVRR